MKNLEPRRAEVKEALSKVSEEAKEFYSGLYPFIHSEFFIHERVEKLDEFFPAEVRELAKAGLLKITVRLETVGYDDTYRAWNEMRERVKDLPLRNLPGDCVKTQ